MTTEGQEQFIGYFDSACIKPELILLGNGYRLIDTNLININIKMKTNAIIGEKVGKIDMNNPTLSIKQHNNPLNYCGKMPNELTNLYEKRFELINTKLQILHDIKSTIDDIYNSATKDVLEQKLNFKQKHLKSPNYNEKNSDASYGYYYGSIIKNNEYDIKLLYKNIKKPECYPVENKKLSNELICEILILSMLYHLYIVVCEYIKYLETCKINLTEEKETNSFKHGVSYLEDFVYGGYFKEICINKYDNGRFDIKYIIKTCNLNAISYKQQKTYLGDGYVFCKPKNSTKWNIFPGSIDNIEIDENKITEIIDNYTICNKMKKIKLEHSKDKYICCHENGNIIKTILNDIFDNVEINFEKNK